MNITYIANDCFIDTTGTQVFLGDKFIPTKDLGDITELTNIENPETKIYVNNNDIINRFGEIDDLSNEEDF